MQSVASNGHSWLFDLTNPDPAHRRAALDRQAELIATWSDGLRWSNTLWYQNGGSSDFSHSPTLTAEYDQALAKQQNAIAQTLYSLAGEFGRACSYQELDEAESAPYSILYLQWEVAFQHEWRTAAPWSPWGLKQRILRGFITAGPLGWEQALIDLVMAAINREHRCEDRWYAALARRLNSPELRNLLAEAAASPDPIVRLRAGYVTAVLNDRSMAVTVASWRRWLAATNG